MTRRRLTRRQQKKAQAKTISRSPNWLRTVQIGSGPKPERVRGTFGAASAVVRIDPETGLPLTD